MNKFLLKLKNKELTPSSKIVGGVMWNLNRAPKSLEVRLFWLTSGRVTDDLQVIETKRLNATEQGKEKFEFTLPAAPYSFSGKLITLTWAVDFIDNTGKNFATEEFFLSPTGKEFQL